MHGHLNVKVGNIICFLMCIYAATEIDEWDNNKM